MSTRATYEIHGQKYAPPVTFYIHHDGYPSGAVKYWQAARVFGDESPNASFADKFHRANVKSEYTTGHSDHGDTQYRYSYHVERDFLTVEMRIDFGTEWKTIFNGTLAMFIEQYGKK